MIESMFHVQVPILEKILRPFIVYLLLILFLRLFGKRELAQLNPFDLVVLLSLSNTVQNAIIGNDNSVSGGIIGAFSLLTCNWLLTRFLFHSPRINDALQGNSTCLITDGVIDQAAMRSEVLLQNELLSVLHKQGVDSINDVRKCVLEPNGTFYVETRKPTDEQKTLDSLTEAVQFLNEQVASLRAELHQRPSRQ